MKSDIDKGILARRRQVWGEDYRRLSFPVKLHALLSCGRFPNALWWLEDGEAFAVAREGYKKEIMSVFFDEHKFRSLQTLLHKHGFRMITSVNNEYHDILIYQHNLFVRDKPDLCKAIVRTCRKETRKQKKKSSIKMLRSSNSSARDRSVSFKEHEPPKDQAVPKQRIPFRPSDEGPPNLSVLAAAADTVDCCSLASIDSLPLRAESSGLGAREPTAQEDQDSTKPQYKEKQGSVSTLPPYVGPAAAPEDTLDGCSLSSETARLL